MSFPTNEKFSRLIEMVKSMGEAAHARASDTDTYKTFIAAFPLDRLPTLGMDDYCVGKGDNHSFSWWIERGLEPVMGRYMPGTSTGHMVYFRKEDGSIYKNRQLKSLSDTDALRYTLKVQTAIAAADPTQDIRWIDDDTEIYRRAGVEPRVTVAPGRKLRLLACYHPEDVLLFSSSAHIGHFLKALGYPEQDIPDIKKPVSRMLTLREYYLIAKQAVPSLSTRGFILALYNPSLGIAPVKQKDEPDDQPEDDEGPANAYLLTWNPEHVKLGGDGGVVVGEEQQWTCHSKQPKIGDTVYLIRLGQEPRGIVAWGVVTEGSHEAPHWRDPSKQTEYIRFRVEEFRPDPASGLLPMVLLNLAAPDQKWSPQSSGIGIPEHIERTLRNLWEAGVGVHSLRQFVNWISENRKALADDWLVKYQKTAALARSLRDDPNRIDEQALDELWRNPNNGVSGVGPGGLSHKEFNENHPLLVELTREILTKPTAETLSAVEKSWRQAVSDRKLRQMSRAVIRRVFAAVSPESLTTLLRESDCQRLLGLLKHQFELAPEVLIGTEWMAQNAYIVACMKLGGLDAQHTLENNFAMWQLLESSSAVTKSELTPSEDLKGDHSAKATVRPAAPTNLVLFGPPGTGKTYRTIEEAIEIVAPELLEGEPHRYTLKKAFDTFVASGQIVFTTFHQSFSYEDFVEGLRANSKDGELEYMVEPGVFKRLCERAAQGRIAAEDPFDKALIILQARMDEADDGGLKMSTGRGKIFKAIYDGGDTFRVFPASSVVMTAGYTASMRHVRNLFAGADEQLMYNASYVRGMLAYLRQYCGLPESPASSNVTATPKPFVLIIDEINRGNVSRIFGELITLIEPSKRAGMDEALEVTLPYSKERFSVPANLHIIGTMNTADRSLSSLDIALRRRFSFIEMPPLPDRLNNIVIGDINIGTLLRSMNDRIEVLLDRDHCLGHTYFLPLENAPTLNALATIFRQQILPLLQEYFFEDWERICWVLNDHCKTNLGHCFVSRPTSKIFELFGASVDGKVQDNRWVINDAAFDSSGSYLDVIGVPA